MRLKTKNITGRLLALALVCGLANCAYLPDSKKIRQQQPPLNGSALTVVDGQRLLTEQQAEQVLRPVLAKAQDTGQLRQLLKLEELVSGNPLVIDNNIQLLIDGEEAYAAIFEEIEKAQEHIHIISYIFADDEVGQRLAQLLKDKVAQGV
ncbi:MAG: hypothetical protein R3352_10305, partial [Salinisphaeraceae bacterium]|nr:hypothetical protein [Salinisphaeraceae bacterium]